MCGREFVTLSWETWLIAICMIHCLCLGSVWDQHPIKKKDLYPTPLCHLQGLVTAPNTPSAHPANQRAGGFTLRS